MTKNTHDYVIVIKVIPNSDAEFDLLSYIMCNVNNQYDVTGVGGIMTSGSERKPSEYIIMTRWMEDLAEVYCYIKKELKRRKPETWEIIITEYDRVGEEVGRCEDLDGKQ